VALVTLEDFTADFACGWDTATGTGDPRTVGHGWVQEQGSLAVITPGAKARFSVGTDVVGNQTVIKSSQYLVVVVLNDQGAWVLLSTWGTVPALLHGSNDPIGIPAYPQARLLYVDSNGSAATLYPYVSALGTITSYPNGHAVEDVRMPDLPAPYNVADGIAASADRFTRADSNVSMGGSWTPVVGTWGIASNQGRLRTDGSGNNLAIKDDGLTDRMIAADLSYATGVARAGVILRYQDANNYVEWHNNGSTTGNRIDKVVAGVRTVVSSSSQPALSLGTTYRYTFIVKGARYQVLRDATLIADWTNESGANFLTATKYGVSQFSGFLPSVQVVDNAASYPLVHTLPAVIGQGAVPRILTAGATLGNDTFTDTNGVRLGVHTAEAGGAWTEHSRHLDHPGQPGECDAGGSAAIATQSLGATDVEVSVTVVAPNPLTDADDIAAGIVVRYVDANNYIVVRCLQTPSQVNSHEIELAEVIGGSGPVVHKPNLGDTIRRRWQLRADGAGGRHDPGAARRRSGHHLLHPGRQPASRGSCSSRTPLINRAVTLAGLLRLRAGHQSSAATPEVNDVVQAFMEDPKNKAELTSQQARTEKEQTLQVDGNLFFVLFTNRRPAGSGSAPSRSTRSTTSSPTPRTPASPGTTGASGHVPPPGSHGPRPSEHRIVYYPDWRYRRPTKPADHRRP
jgi:hypothetical protein